MRSPGNSSSPSLPLVDPVPSKWVEANYYMRTARMLWIVPNVHDEGTALQTWSRPVVEGCHQFSTLLFA